MGKPFISQNIGKETSPYSIQLYNAEGSHWEDAYPFKNILVREGVITEAERTDFAKDPMMDTMAKYFVETMREERASGGFIPKVGFASAEKPRVRVKRSENNEPEDIDAAINDFLKHLND